MARDQKEQQATTTANVGSYPVPLGEPLRRLPRRRKRRKRVAEQLQERGLTELWNRLLRAARRTLS